MHVVYLQSLFAQIICCISFDLISTENVVKDDFVNFTPEMLSLFSYFERSDYQSGLIKTQDPIVCDCFS